MSSLEDFYPEFAAAAKENADPRYATFISEYATAWSISGKPSLEVIPVIFIAAVEIESEKDAMKRARIAGEIDMVHHPLLTFFRGIITPNKLPLNWCCDPNVLGDMRIEAAKKEIASAISPRVRARLKTTTNNLQNH